MPTLETVQRFERYKIIQWLGSSVSGESYEAEDTMLLRKVALKLIHPAATLPDATRRQFFREMQGISILSHNYLAPVLDYGEFEGKLYVARRFVSNGSLLGQKGREWFQAPLDLFDTIHYTHQLAQALQHIHNRGYSHGALTLANILVLHRPHSENASNDAPFLLADAGLTRFIRRFGEKYTTPLPITAAPEQLYKRIIPASDQYALAVLLYFWLVGHPPFIGSPEEIDQLKLTETITPLSTLDPSFTVQLDEVILRALSVSPEDRYQSVQAFADALLTTVSPKNQPILKQELFDKITSNVLVVSEPAYQPFVEQATAPIQQEPDLITQSVIDVPQSSLDILESNTLPESVQAASLQTVKSQEHQSVTKSEDSVKTAHFIIVSPYIDEPYTVELHDDEMTIGRAGSSDIFLERDELTSRHHALLKRQNNRFVIYDRRSANGIQVNGKRIQDENGTPLTDGDTITIGNFRLAFHTALSTTIDQTDRSLASTS